jgi:hypothetical protein
MSEDATRGGVTDLGNGDGVGLVTIAYVVVTIIGLGAWIAATRVYSAIRRTVSLRWSLHLVVAITLLIAVIGMAIGVEDSGILGASVAFGVTGLIALAISLGVWHQASVTRIASNKLDATFSHHPELKHKFRKHSLLRRILRG